MQSSQLFGGEANQTSKSFKNSLKFKSVRYHSEFLHYKVSPKGSAHAKILFASKKNPTSPKPTPNPSTIILKMNQFRGCFHTQLQISTLNLPSPTRTTRCLRLTRCFLFPNPRVFPTAKSIRSKRLVQKLRPISSKRIFSILPRSLSLISFHGKDTSYKRLN